MILFLFFEPSWLFSFVLPLELSWGIAKTKKTNEKTNEKTKSVREKNVLGNSPGQIQGQKEKEDP